MRAVALLAVWAICAGAAFGQTKPATTQAVTKPSPFIDLVPLRGDLTKAEKGLEAARRNAIERWEASEDGKKLRTEFVYRRQLLEEARASGTPQQRLDASAAYNKARIAFEKASDAAVVTQEVADTRVVVGRAKMAIAEAENYNQQIRDVQQLAERLKAAKFNKDLTPYDFELGAVGFVRLIWRFRVVSVISDDEVLVSAVNVEKNDITVIVKGVSTKGMVDGAEFRFGQRVKVTRTRKYQSVSGERTVFEIAPVEP